MNRKENKMSKKWIGMIAVLVSVATANGAVIFLEEFDGNNKGYRDASAGSPGNVWVDFGDRITVSDIGGVEGYTTAAVGTESVLAGAAGAGQNDPQIRSDWDVGITDASSVTNISWRIRMDRDDNGSFDDVIATSDVDVYTGAAVYLDDAGNATGAGSTMLRGDAGVTSTITADGSGSWYVINYSFSTNTLTAIRSLRIDPVNNLPGRSYEIDWIKIEAIPEPATLGLFFISGAGVLMARRMRH